MSFRTFLLLTAIATAAPACTVHVMEPGAVLSDGSVYLGFSLVSADKKADHEEYPIGEQLGAFSSIRLHAGDPVSLSRVIVIFANGERFTAPTPASLGKGQWTNSIALPGAPRPIHSITIDARDQGKGLAKIEIYGKR